MNLISKTTSSLFLVTLLLSGCGSSNSSMANNTDNNTKIAIEQSKQDRLEKELRSDGVEYKTSTYSQDKSEILLAGIKDGKTTIYKFDASSLELIEKFSFDIDGLLDIKSEKDGKYTITAQNESGADNFMFDSVSGELLKSSDDNQDLTDTQIAENFINSAKNRATDLDIKNFNWDKDEGWDKMEFKTELTENLYVAQLTRDVDKDYGLYDYDFVIFDTKKMQIIKVLSRQRVGMIESPNLELKGYATNFSVDKDSNTLTYHMNGKDKKLSYNYKTDTLTTDKDLLKALNKQTDEELVAYSYSKNKNGIFAISVSKGYKFYRFDAKTLELEKIYKSKEYGATYDLGDYNISNSDITPLEDGKFEIKKDFGTYVFDYLKGSGDWKLENNIVYSNDYNYEELLNVAKKHKFENSSRTIYSLDQILAVEDNKFIAIAETMSVRTVLITIDMNNKIVNDFGHIPGSEQSFSYKHIDKKNHTLIYKYTKSGFSQYQDLYKIDYKIGKVIKRIDLSHGMGG